MRPASSLVQLAVCLSSLASLTAALPGDFLPEPQALAVRADPTSEASETASATKKDASESPTPTKKAPTSVNLNTAKPQTGSATDEEDSTETGTGKSDKTKSNGDDDEDSHTTFAANDPQGGVSMTEPKTNLQPTPLFKIGDWVTLGWNYTDLQGTPTAIDVLISQSQAAQTWTLTSNMTFETAVTYLWNTNDTASDPEKPLGVNLYTLVIKDSDVSITDRAEPGYLGVYNSFKFGLYTPRDYTPLPELQCTGCSRGISTTERQALGFALTMSVITVFSFTWFVTGLGLQ